MKIQKAQLYPALVLLISLGTLVSAYSAQYIFGLEPCILCLYQRIPFAIAGVLALVGVVRPNMAPTIMLVLVGVFAFEAGLAFYHVGVEQHWWASATGCTGGNISSSPLEMLQNIQKSKPKPCDEVDWTFIGISMATWNVLFSTLLAMATFVAWRILGKEK